MEFEKALDRMKRYCAYQDRCHLEVSRKLYDIGIYGDDKDQVMAELIEQNFLNEERFAKSFARGKFRMKKWGRNKILNGLQERQISDYCIRKGLKEIEEDEYIRVLKEILISQIRKYNGENALIAKDKAIKYASKRGYEAPIIFAIVKEIELDSDSFL
ncbi:MAG: RecX family transcriptional regulator [Saprospiraceae bacterium]|nr:RecX family transcriptional regulator [Bacteroidia bacterium]MBT8229361.1 RecX family transcriptional regulator [Bacteroidia bacterium]NNF21681.1 RecX family transcriptional regulator [Saprospiraceae bacterium]NNK89747.1 RecX family transcriptional regulator [Saprospiraceae bacterium]